MDIANALIGYSGFVGSSLTRQQEFRHLYLATNISEIRRKSFQTLVCASAECVNY
jgi:hypothetical protein